MSYFDLNDYIRIKEDKRINLYDFFKLMGIKEK